MSFTTVASRARAVLTAHPWITDGLLWAAPAAWLSVNSILARVWVDTTSTLPQWLHVAVALLMTLPLALRRLRPFLSSILIAVGCVLSLLSGTGPSLAIMAVPLTVFSTAKWGSRGDSRIVLALGLIGSLAMGVWAYMVALQSSMGPSGRPIDASEYSALAVLVVLCAAIVLSAWLLGILAYRRRAAVEDIRERNRLLEKERESESRLAADAERMRIAREMHDIIAHSLSVVIAQADGGRYAAKDNPEAAEAALTTIAATGRDALAQTRSLLGVLRADALADESTAPLPGLAAVPSLVDDVRATGLAVSIEGFDAPEENGSLSEGAGLAVYRIVQEALTNVLKHAGSGARAQVALTATDRGLIVRISDDGGPARPHGDRARSSGDPERSPGDRARLDGDRASRASGASAAEGTGSGIVGMRERATLYGGSLDAGAHRGGERGFTVTARFPSAGPPAASPTEAVPATAGSQEAEARGTMAQGTGARGTEARYTTASATTASAADTTTGKTSARQATGAPAPTEPPVSERPAAQPPNDPPPNAPSPASGARASTGEYTPALGSTRDD